MSKRKTNAVRAGQAAALATALAALTAGCASFDDLGPREYPLGDLVGLEITGEEPSADASAKETSTEADAERADAEAAGARPEGPGAEPILDGVAQAEPKPAPQPRATAEARPAEPKPAEPRPAEPKPAAETQIAAAAAPKPKAEPKPAPQARPAVQSAPNAGAATAAEMREVVNTIRVFDTACLEHRRSASNGVARLKAIGFKTVNGPNGGRLVLDNMIADARIDPEGGVRCFTATPVTDVNGFVSAVDQLMRERFDGLVTRGAVNGAPAWRATPSGESAFLVAVRAARQSPDKPVVAIATLIAPQS